MSEKCIDIIGFVWNIMCFDIDWSVCFFFDIIENLFVIILNNSPVKSVKSSVKKVKKQYKILIESVKAGGWLSL